MPDLALLACAQGEALPAISRFQAVAVGSEIYIHTHRSLQDVLVLDVADPDAPDLALQPVASEHDPPMSRFGSPIRDTNISPWSFVIQHSACTCVLFIMKITSILPCAVGFFHPWSCRRRQRQHNRALPCCLHAGACTP